MPTDTRMVAIFRAFEMSEAEREGYAASLRELAPGESFQLARAIAQPGAALVRDTGVGPDDDGEGEDGQGAARGVHVAHRQRSKLSQLSFKLLSDTRLHQVGCGPRGHADQHAAIDKAARGISLGGNLMLSGVLTTDPGQLDDLVSRVRSRAHWPKGRRPHGVLVFIAERIEDDVILTVSGTRLTVEGPIAVFGPGRGNTRSGPFVVAVLVASPDGCAPLVPLKAYAHPCWTATTTDTLPLDGTNERRCLDILVRFSGWMGRQGYTVEITKPLHDRSRYDLGGEDADQVVKPDFEGKVFAADGRFARSYVIEVMGLNHALYRAKTQRLKAILTRKPGRYLEHQAHDGIDPAEGDCQFRKDLLRFGKSVIYTPPPPSTSTPTPAFVPLPPAPLPAPPWVLPPASPLLHSAVFPAPAEVSQRLFGTPTPWPIAASAAPVPGASSQLPLEGGNTLGRLAHRLLTALGIKHNNRHGPASPAGRWRQPWCDDSCQPSAVQGVLHGLRRRERELAAGSQGYGLAGCGVAAFALRPVLDLELAEGGQRNLVAAFGGLDHGLQRRFDHLAGLPLVQALLGGDPLGEFGDVHGSSPSSS